MENNNNLDYSTFSEIVTLYKVYKDGKKLYIDKDTCYKFNVGNKKYERTIRNKTCYKVTDEDINKLSYISKDHYQPKYIPIMNFDLKITLTIYIDNDNKKYIESELCSVYGINIKDEININNTLYSSVTEKEIEFIENHSLNKGILLKKIYKKLPISNKKLFVYYNCLDDKKLYIKRETLETARNYNIELEAIPKIINNNNCYSILKEQLEEYENKTNTRGIEQLINNSKNNKKIKNILETRIVYKDKLNNKIYIPEEYATKKDRNKKIILNKLCYEATINEIECIYNKKIFIVDVYTKKEIEKEKLNIIICNNNGRLFISEINAIKLNIKPISNKKIKIKNDYYKEIDNNSINEINNNNKYDVNIIYKNIVPLTKE